MHLEGNRILTNDRQFRLLLQKLSNCLVSASTNSIPKAFSHSTSVGSSDDMCSQLHDFLDLGWEKWWMFHPNGIGYASFSMWMKRIYN